MLKNISASYFEQTFLDALIDAHILHQLNLLASETHEATVSFIHVEQIFTK
jgi:hypothetical protein